MDMEIYSVLVFDIYSFELCLMMAKSSTIMFIPDNLAMFPVKILQMLEKYKSWIYYKLFDDEIE